MENHGGMILAEETPDLSTRALWQFYHLVAGQEERGKGDDGFSLRNIFVHTSK
jgi:hypothetical protein